ncbi:MAG TPA: exodeoxyribonuclease VII large subunit [Vicinamibacterales bacterium]|nr:exodeoxyribonuclease VII large subunit [Vicinamibacterales bacterium]
MPDLFDQPFEEPPVTREDVAPVRARRRIVTVSEVTAEIRSALESGFGELWIEGEISNCRVWNTGHVYFTLKDPAAQLKAVMFRSAYRYLKFKIEDGIHVVARGRLGVYEPKGEYQLVCEHLEPQGRGALQLAFEQLKRKLQAEGLFAADRKRPIPSLPRKIGIVTSLDGAALRDILKVLGRRHPNAHIVVRPVRVQGDGAADDIARALKAIAKVPGIDVVIIGRGGGSIEDLWAFNEESLARTIAACAVPVISAVGHEVDVTIADFVADLRAPTPSAAAEMVVTAKEEFGARIDRLHGRLTAAMRSDIQRRRNVLHVLTSRRGLAGWHVRVALQGRHVSELTHALRRSATALVARRAREHQGRVSRLEANDVRRRLAAMRGRVGAADSRLHAIAGRVGERARARFAALTGRLETLSPLAVLARGYAVCWNDDRTAIIRQASAVTPGDRVRVTLHEGELDCEVRIAHGSDNQGL